MFMCIYILMCIYIFCLCVCLISLFRPVFGNWTVINAIYAWVIKIKKDILAIILMAIISPGTEKREKKIQYFSSVFKSNADCNTFCADDH